MDPTGGKVRDFELDADRSFPFAPLRAPHASSEPTGHAAPVFVVPFDGWQAELGPHQELLAPPKLLDLPDDGRLFGRVVDGADVGAEARRIGVFGDGHEDLDVIRGGAAFELGSCLLGVFGWVLAGLVRRFFFSLAF